MIAKAFYFKTPKKLCFSSINSLPPTQLIIPVSSTHYKVDLPLIRESRNNTKKIKNKIFAIPAAPAAMPPNPNIAAIIAITRNVIVQPNIIVIFKG